MNYTARTLKFMSSTTRKNTKISKNKLELTILKTKLYLLI